MVWTRLHRFALFASLFTCLSASGCGTGKASTTAGAVVYSPSLTYSTNSHVNTVTPFPTGSPITHRLDVEASLTRLHNVQEAVVICSDSRTYIAIKTFSKPLNPTERSAIVDTARASHPDAGRIFVTDKLSAYADLRNYARYLDKGRNFQGMLLSWRSIVRSAFGVWDV